MYFIMQLAIVYLHLIFWHTHLPNSTEELQFLDEGKNPSCILEAFCIRKSRLKLPNRNIPGTKKAKHADVWNTAYLNSSNAYMAQETGQRPWSLQDNLGKSQEKHLVDQATGITKSSRL